MPDLAFRSRRACAEGILSSMPQQRFQELADRLNAELQEYVNEGFRASDCFPFVFQNLVESSGLSGADRAELHRQLKNRIQKAV